MAGKVSDWKTGDKRPKGEGKVQDIVIERPFWGGENRRKGVESQVRLGDEARPVACLRTVMPKKDG
jgi:hypothetical protein